MDGKAQSPAAILRMHSWSLLVACPDCSMSTMDLSLLPQEPAYDTGSQFSLTHNNFNLAQGCKGEYSSNTTVEQDSATAGGLIAAVKAHIAEGSSSCLNTATWSCPPQATGYHCTGNTSALPDPETLPNEALDLFPKPQMVWLWKLASDMATPVSPGKLQADSAADAAACSPGGRSIGKEQRPASWCSSPAGSEWAPEAAVLSPQCEQRLHMSIKQGLLEELRSDYEHKQMETEADCVARIVAVEMSCTDKIATLAQQHHVGLERIKQLVKSKAARFQKALKLETAIAYRVGYKAAMRRQAASGPAPSKPQDSSTAAVTRSEAQQLRTAGNQSERAGQQQGSPAGQRRKVRACTCTSASDQHSADSSPVSSSPKERSVKVYSRVARKLAQHSPRALSAAAATGAGAAAVRLRMGTSPLPAHVQAHPSPQLLSVAMRVSKDDSRAPVCQAGSHDDQQDPALIPLPVSLLSKLTAAPAAANPADATATADAAAGADTAGTTDATETDATGEADAAATMGADWDWAAVAGPGSIVTVGGGLFGARVTGFSECGLSYGGLHREFSKASFGRGLFAEPSYTPFTPGAVYDGSGLQREVSEASLGEGLFAEPSYTAFPPGILLGAAPCRMAAVQPVCGDFAGPAHGPAPTAVGGASGAAAGVQAAAAAGSGSSKGGVCGDGVRGFSRVLQPLGDVGNVLGGAAAASGSGWNIGVSPIGSRRQVSRAASLAVQAAGVDGEEAKSSVMQLFELPTLENLL